MFPNVHHCSRTFPNVPECPFPIVPEFSRTSPNVLESSRLLQNILEEEVVDARAKLWTARAGQLQLLEALLAELPRVLTIQAGLQAACGDEVGAEREGLHGGERVFTWHFMLTDGLLLVFLLSFRACSGLMKIFSRVAPCLHRLVRWPEPIDFKYESNQRYLCAMTESRMPKRRLAPEA